MERKRGSESQRVWEKAEKIQKKQTQRREIEQNQKIGIRVQCKEVNGQI